LIDRLEGTHENLRLIHNAEIARPFEWSFIRVDLDRVIERITEREPQLRLCCLMTRTYGCVY
jgi:hypothetical protein